MKSKNTTWLAVGVMSSLATALLFVAGSIVSRPAPTHVELVSAAQKAVSQSCKSGLSSIGFQQTAKGVSIEAFKGMTASPQQAALEVALALQLCPQHTLVSSCIGATCEDPEKRVQLVLQPKS